MRISFLTQGMFVFWTMLPRYLPTYAFVTCRTPTDTPPTVEDRSSTNQYAGSILFFSIQFSPSHFPMWRIERCMNHRGEKSAGQHGAMKGSS